MGAFAEMGTEERYRAGRVGESYQEFAGEGVCVGTLGSSGGF
jgi:hypothetical protein